jgi:tetratricopeptide (TPR) repeat protein
MLTGIDDILKLKQRATALRNVGAFEKAIATLDEVTHRLEALIPQASGDDDVRRIRAELADAYGMKGEVHRRWLGGDDHLGRALAMYKLGRDIESELQLSTYNSSNVITLAITHEKKGMDASLRKDLDSVIAGLERDTKGPRSDEFWAWADLAQFCLLRGDVDRARDSYREALKRGPTTTELKRHVEILRELAAGIRDTEPDKAETITAAARELEDVTR